MAVLLKVAQVYLVAVVVKIGWVYCVAVVDMCFLNPCCMFCGGGGNSFRNSNG